MCMSLPSFQDGKNDWDSDPGVSLALPPRLQSIIPIGMQRDGFAATVGSCLLGANPAQRPRSDSRVFTRKQSRSDKRGKIKADGDRAFC